MSGAVLFWDLRDSNNPPVVALPFKEERSPDSQKRFTLPDELLDGLKIETSHEGAALEELIRIGDAEGDFIVSGRSGKGICLVIVDRKARTSFLERILRPSCAAVAEACTRIKKRYPEWKSMTTDNDILFQHHKKLARTLKIKIYFCHPYHSWEKGSVENANKHIRKTIPRGSDISRYTKTFIKKLEVKLNRRIMECLGYHTPSEVLRRCRKRKKRSRA